MVSATGLETSLCWHLGTRRIVRGAPRTLGFTVLNEAEGHGFVSGQWLNLFCLGSQEPDALTPLGPGCKKFHGLTPRIVRSILHCSWSWRNLTGLFPCATVKKSGNVLEP
ncbi:hypothetical protein VULLAG_LOCUS17720 [Vulpes lagopus]